jgi:hypothetical protein
MYIVVDDILDGLFLHLFDSAMSSGKDIHGVVSYKKCPDYCQSFSGRMCDIWNIGIGKTTWQEMDKKYL